MSQIDLLVVNYNTRDKIHRFIEALNKSPKTDNLWKLYVADNGSTDDSEQLIHQLTGVYPIETFFVNKNIGYARAINQMAAASNSPYLAALNADVWMTSEDVASLVEFMSTTPGLGVVGPKQRDEQGRITHAGVTGSNTHPKMRGWQHNDPDDSQYRSQETMITVSGAAFFMPRDVWGEMTNCSVYQKFHMEYFGEEPSGAFPEFHHYYEETLFAYHCRAHGYDVWYDGTVSIGHTWRASTGPSPLLTKYMQESRVGFRKFCDMHNIERD